jgi:hypothetical protein
VIIGLIVSGILAGQDMIKAAEIRSTVSQMDGFNTAVNAFRDKYRNIPGDVVSNDAVRFGFQTRTGEIGRGDGNRLLEAGSAGARTLGHENALFWRDLFQANLVGDTFATATDAFPVGAITAGTMNDWLPEAEIGQGHYFTISSRGGRNFYNIAQVTGVASTTGVYTLGAAMTPQTAFNIDDKMDDGNPVTGIVVAAYDTAAVGVVYDAAAAAGETIAIPAAAVAATATLGAGSCAFGTMTAAGYTTLTDAQANRPACQLRVRASF